MNLEEHLKRQFAFSRATFGPGERRAATLDHIRKEIAEVEAADGDSAEWVDLVILSLDGLMRQLAWAGRDPRHDPGVDPTVVTRTVCAMVLGKQTRNEQRQWPDWRTADPDKAIEHIRDERHE